MLALYHAWFADTIETRGIRDPVHTRATLASNFACNLFFLPLSYVHGHRSQIPVKVFTKDEIARLALQTAK